MRDEAVGFAPCRLTTAALGIMAGFRLHDTHVTGSQAAKTGIAVPLAKAFSGLASAGDTVDLIFIVQLDGLADMLIHRHQSITDR